MKFLLLNYEHLLLTKSVTSGIFFSNSFLPIWYLVFKTKSLASVLLTFAANLSYTVFLTTSYFTTSFNLPRSTGTDPNLSLSNVSTSVFRLAKFVFSAKFEISTCVTFSRSVFVS